MVKQFLTKTKSALRKVHYKREANFYLGVSALIFIGFAYYSVTSYLELSGKEEIVSSSIHLMKGIEANLDGANAEYGSLKETHDALRQTVKDEISAVFPELEEYTELTRRLDDYFKSKSSAKNPLVATSLQYGSAKLSEDGSYYILPITMTISSSEKNFYDFLDYIDKSGSLSSQTRVMDITSIKINFRDPTGKQTEGGEEINFNVQLNAYYQKID